MDNYDEKLNYSFEPADPVPAEPAQPLQQAKEEIRRSGQAYRPQDRGPAHRRWRSSPQPADTR